MSAVSETYRAQFKLPDPIDRMDNPNVGNTQEAGYLRQNAANRSFTEASPAGRPSQRFPKSTSDGNIALRRPVPEPSSAATTGLRSNFGSRRRQSVRDEKEPQAPSSLHSSPSKRISHYNAQRSAGVLPRASHSRQPSNNQPMSYQLDSSNSESTQDLSDTSGTMDFLPSVNFDDFHTSLTTDEPNLSLFPKPGNGASAVLDPPFTLQDQEQKSTVQVPLKTAGPQDTGSRIGRSGSLLPHHNGQTKATAPPRRESNYEAAAANPRTRQLQPPTANINVLRSPRKSVGPGIISQDAPSGIEPSLRPGRGNLEDSPRTGKNMPKPRNSGVNTAAISAARQNKTKSLHLPSGSTQDPFASPFVTPDSTVASPMESRSPGKPYFLRTTTPSSGNRMSMLPNSAYATGLAARTVSPTDARRLKRLSVMPNAPPVPYTPPTPQSEALAFNDLTAASPLLVPRKISTPTSSRTTPEQNRKSYSSCISTSSTTSYNSCQSSTGSVRMSQTFSTSRLPMLKTRHDPLPVGGEEEVPPVPAIPKAYESPKTEVDQPFFSRKSSLPTDSLSVHSVSTPDGIPTPSTDNDASTLPRKPSLRQSLARETPSDYDRKHVVNNANRRTTLQPLRLPPLNLLPLSTPTAAKIAALHNSSGDVDSGTVTPPPRVGQKAIPSTPMTASRASFFAKSQQQYDGPMPVANRLRSSSSHHALRPVGSSHDGAGSSTSNSNSTITDTRDANGRSAVSPFNSSSLPKASGHFGYMRRNDATTLADLRTQTKPTKLTRPRHRINSRNPKEDASSMEESSPVETGTPSFGASIRRKLSLTRKRSGSKSQSRAGSEDEAPPKPPKHSNMPPPKLPASATWNGPLMPSSSPTQKNQALNKRKVSNPGVAPTDRGRSYTWNVDSSPHKPSTPQESSATPTTSRRTTRSTLEGGLPPSGSMSLKDFLKEAKNIEPPLDRDDQQAEDEMKKLASKRKDTENAAKELDALQRRATAKERISYPQAVRAAPLNIFERGEIIDYRDIYFCGTETAKKHIGDLNSETGNFGYDDERGDYNIVTGDHLSYRYEIIDILGKGSFGQVVRCIDHRTGGLVAIKIIRNKKRFHQQALVEVDILKKLRDWDPQRKHSMVQFVQSFYFRGHLCISTELLGMNLYEFIKCHDFRGFSLKLIRRFAKQLLSSLVLLNGHKIIHCDLKPENILLAHPARSEIRVIDFGSSCMEKEKVYTYIQSRFYRSPEVILGMTYGMPIDMWSLGCILAELLTGYPIFPGENEQEQLACIMEVFGPPEKHLIEKSTRKKLFFDSLGKPRLTVSSKGKRRRPSSKTLQQAIKCEDEAFLDFISKCLRWDPDRRLKPDEAIQHDFITGNKSPTTKNMPASATRVINPSGAPISSRSQHLNFPSTARRSPSKRLTSIQTPSAATSSNAIRPLPDPPAQVPATALKFPAPGTTNPNRPIPHTLSYQATSTPTSKAAATTASAHMKRHSTVNGGAANSNANLPAAKRTINGQGMPSLANGGASALPRVQSQGVRSVSEKNDLAVAGAVASLQKSR